MEQKFFEWSAYSGENGQLLFPVDAMEEIFLVNAKEEEIWLSRKCAELFATDSDSLKAKMSRRPSWKYEVY